ncbi:MAG: hypothetical protein Q8K89_07165, partial [Actinomycetota bacterium]|nr:hypothetical protein [Actinomycetota bacterium]
MRLRRVGFGGFVTALAVSALFVFLPTVASADTVGPTFSAQSPADGSVLASRSYVDAEDYYGHIPISVTVSDPDGVPDQTWGGSVSTGGYNFGFYPTATRVNATTVILTELNSYVADGLYQVTANARDSLGNAASTTWSFTFDEGYPYISAWGPASDSWKANDPIYVDATDVGSGVSPASVIMTVDGTLVMPSTSVAGNTLRASYVPLAPLALGVHIASVSCVDRVGHPTSKTWTFNVVATNTAPQVIWDSNTSGRQLISGGYWNYDENGQPTDWVPPTASQTFQLLDSDVIERTSLVMEMSDSTNTTTRTVSPWTSWSSGDQRLSFG